MAEGGYINNSESQCVHYVKENSTIQDCKDICSVCLELIREPRSLPCGHRFCALCLIGYIDKCLKTESSDNFPCPLCRAEIHVSNYTLSSEKDDTTKLDLLSFSQMCNENESRHKVDTICQPCKRGNEIVEGTHFCSQCNECICTECVKHHSRNKLTCNHTVTKVETDGQTKQDAIPSDFPTKCELHDKKFKYVCLNHDILCCSKCVIEGGHRKCTNVKSLVEFKQSNNYNAMVRKVEKISTTVSKDVEILNKQQLKCISDVANKTSCFMKTTKTLEDEMLLQIAKQIHKQRDYVLENLRLFEDKSTKAVQTLKQIDRRMRCNKLFLNQVKENDDATNNVTVLYGILKHVESEENLVREMANTLGNVTPSISVEINPIMKHLHSVCQRLNSEKCPLIGLTGYRRPSLKTHKPKPEKINDMIFLQNGNVVIADETSSLSVLDSNLNSILKVSLSSQPVGVTEYDQNTIAVALPERKCLAIVTFHGSSYNKTEVDIGRVVTCLASGNLKGNQVILTYEPENCSICYEIVKQKEFKTFALNVPNVHKICLDATAQRVYVLQRKINKIIGFASDGTPKFVFTHHQLHTPVGIHLHKTNKLYLCCYGTQQINEIIISSRELNNVICSSEGLKGPLALSFDKEMSKCLVYDSDKGKDLKLYDM